MSAKDPAPTAGVAPTFGQLLIDLRTSIHLTQRQVAELFHTSEDNYAHYEHNRRTPDRARVIEFLRNFHRRYPTVLTEQAARTLLAVYDPARPVNGDEWESIFGQTARRSGAAPLDSVPDGRPRVFVGYLHEAQPDAAIARQVQQTLGRDYAVSGDPPGPAGARWAQQLDQELRRADFLVLLLSAAAAESEMLLAVIEQAAALSQGAGRPVILPVRLAYRGPLPYPLRNVLGSRNALFWQDPADTPALLADLRHQLNAERGMRITDMQLTGSRRLPLPAFSPSSAWIAAPDSQHSALSTQHSAFAPPAPLAQPVGAGAAPGLEMPEGTMDPQSAFYVVRPSDLRAEATIRQQGVTITIKGPRQMGKSSLLYRTISTAGAAGKRVILLDFQLFDQTALANGETFLRQFCAWLGDELGLPERIDEFWRLPLGNIQRCTNYLKKYLLPQLDRPLVLAMDEVDRIFDTEYRSDFFGMLRSWHNMRQAAVGPGTAGLWKRLDLVLVTSTEPYQFVANLNQSPFNVGCIIDLEDLSAAQVADLNGRHGAPLAPDETRRLMTLVGGQPYLVRRALYLVAGGQLAPADLFATATHDQGPFGDHLRYHLFRLYERPELVEALRVIIRTRACHDEQIFFRLRGAGLVKREGTAVLPRYPLYADYFREHLHG